MYSPLRGLCPGLLVVVLAHFLPSALSATQDGDLCMLTDLKRPVPEVENEYFVCIILAKDLRKDFEDLQGLGSWKRKQCEKEDEQFVVKAQDCLNKKKIRRQQAMCGANLGGVGCGNCNVQNQAPLVGGACNWPTAPLSPDPNSQSAYLQCSQQQNNACGQWQSTPCPTNTVFNAPLSICAPQPQQVQQQSCGLTSVSIGLCGTGQTCPGNCQCMPQAQTCCCQIAQQTYSCPKPPPVTCPPPPPIQCPPPPVLRCPPPQMTDCPAPPPIQCPAPPVIRCPAPPPIRCPAPPPIQCPPPSARNCPAPPPVQCPAPPQIRCPAQTIQCPRPPACVCPAPMPCFCPPAPEPQCQCCNTGNVAVAPGINNIVGNIGGNIGVGVGLGINTNNCWNQQPPINTCANSATCPRGTTCQQGGCCPMRKHRK